MSNGYDQQVRGGAVNSISETLQVLHVTVTSALDAYTMNPNPKRKRHPNLTVLRATCYPPLAPRPSPLTTHNEESDAEEAHVGEVV